MPSNQTANYALNQWSKDDRVLMEDFNADNARIDAALKAHSDALAAMPKIVTGYYTGDGEETRFISLDFTPKAVLVFSKGGFTYYVTGTYTRYLYGGLAVTGHSVVLDGMTALSIQPGGFQVIRKQKQESTNYYNAYLNSNNVGYIYLAIG